MFSRISNIFIACIMLIVLVGVLQAAAVTEEEMLAVWQEVQAAFNAHDAEAIAAHSAEDVILDYVPAPPPIEGVEAGQAWNAGLFEAFPDIHWETQRRLVSGNILVEEFLISGTQKGEWMGIPATGNSGQAFHLEIVEFEEDKTKRSVIYLDNVTVLVELGLMPPSELPDLTPSFALPDPEPTGLAPVEADAEFYSRFNTHNMSEFAKMLHRDAEIRFNALGMIPMNREEYVALTELYLLSNSTLQGETVRRVDLGDGWVLAEQVYRGINDGPYFGIPASGRPVEVRSASIAHYDADGLLTNFNFYFDNLTVLTQIGAFPPSIPEPPPLPPIPDYVVQDQITSPSLEGNLLGDPATRDVLMYLPLSYNTSPDKRYPTIYLLHGYTGDHRLFVGVVNASLKALTGMDFGIDLGDIVTELLTTGQMGEVIIVLPDAKNVYGGSWYERSDVLGDYRNYIARDLVKYIDSKYRTIPDKEHRAIAGHSMGGYGAFSLAIEYPDVFGAVAALSPGFPNDVEAPPTIIDTFIAENPDKLGEPIMISTDDDMWRMFLTNFQTNIMYSAAAAYSPNPDNPPYYVDLPIQYPEKTIVEDVWSKWKERDLVSQIEQNGANLSDTAIFIDKGVGQTVVMEEVHGVELILAALDAQGIPYTYDEFDGDHITHLRYQLASALKFLSPHIGAFPPPPDKEAVRELARRGFEDIWNQKNLGAIDELMSPEYVVHDPTGDFVGPEAFKQFVADYLTAFPDIQFTLHDIIVEGELAAIRWTSHGTHLGEFLGVPPSGKKGPGNTGISIGRYVNGKQVEAWNNWDTLGLLQWLGLIPSDRETFTWSEPSEATGAPGDPEENKAIHRRAFEEVWNQGNLAVVDEIFAIDYILHNPVNPGIRGPEGYKQFVTIYRTAFPDITFTVEAQIAEGDKVVTRWTSRGTHQGELMGIPPTGKQVTVTGISILRIADGKIVDDWVSWDTLGMMQQLGVIPPMAPKDYSNVFFMPLARGLNMISLPLEPITPYTARSFAEELSATVVIKLDEKRQRFVGFTLDAPDDGFAIEGGKGYIVNVPESRVIAFTGAAWTNQPPVESAAPILAQSDGAWAYVVSGRFLDDSNDNLKRDGYLVTVRNTRTNAVATDVVRKGYFAAAFADLNRKNVVQTGDRLEIQLRNRAGEIVSDTLSYTVTSETIRQAFMPLTLKNVEIPRQSLLLQNYPNPFNPETWIPYQIREPADVVIRIYNAKGQLVRTLDLGGRQAGFYLGRSRAAYWDGRNERGERVGSGVYFYQLRAGDFSSTRRMLVVK